jgi:hypothetical protein
MRLDAGPQTRNKPISALQRLSAYYLERRKLSLQPCWQKTGSLRHHGRKYWEIQEGMRTLVFNGQKDKRESLL